MPGGHCVWHAPAPQEGPSKNCQFLASYSDNTSGRGMHRNCIEALKTTQKIGPANGIKLGTTKVLLGSSGGPDNSSIRRQHYLDLGVKTEDIITHPDDIPPSISRLGRERTLADLDRLRAQRATKYGCRLLDIPLGLLEFIRNQSKTSSRVCTLSGSRSSSSKTPGPLGSCTVCAYPNQSTICAGRFRLYILWSTLLSSMTPCAEESEKYCPLRSQTWSGPDSSYLWIWEALVFLIFTTLLNLGLLLHIRNVSNIAPSFSGHQRSDPL
jgi:hypothetical protein